MAIAISMPIPDSTRSEPSRRYNERIDNKTIDEEMEDSVTTGCLVAVVDGLFGLTVPLSVSPAVTVRIGRQHE